MTSSSEQPPKEYIMLQDEMKAIYNFIYGPDTIPGVTRNWLPAEDAMQAILTRGPRPHPAPALDELKRDLDFKQACIENQAMHINTLNAKMVEMMQGAARKAREDVLEAIQDHNDGRLKGMEILFATPSNERTESAQDVYLKEAYFELTLVKHLIESLRSTTPHTEQAGDHP